MTIDLATIKQWFSAIDGEVLGSIFLYLVIGGAMYIFWQIVKGTKGVFIRFGDKIEAILTKWASVTEVWSVDDHKRSVANYDNINEVKATVLRTETKVDKILDKVDKFKEVN